MPCLCFSVCTATCNTGYKFDSGMKSEIRVCDDTTGSWINGDLLPFCVRKYKICLSKVIILTISGLFMIYIYIYVRFINVKIGAQRRKAAVV